MGGFMDKKQIFFSIAGVCFVSVFGTLSHFFYEWSGQNLLVGLFSPVSESVGEHMKLLFFPMLLFVLFTECFLKSRYRFPTASLYLGILLGTCLIPVLYYTYTGILGRSILAADIAVFYASVIGAFLIAYRGRSCRRIILHQNLLKFFVCIRAVTLFLCTFYPPDIGLFRAP